MAAARRADAGRTHGRRHACLGGVLGATPLACARPAWTAREGRQSCAGRTLRRQDAVPAGCCAGRTLRGRRPLPGCAASPRARLRSGCCAQTAGERLTLISLVGFCLSPSRVRCLRTPRHACMALPSWLRHDGTFPPVSDCNALLIRPLHRDCCTLQPPWSNNGRLHIAEACNPHSQQGWVPPQACLTMC